MTQRTFLQRADGPAVGSTRPWFRAHQAEDGGADSRWKALGIAVLVAIGAGCHAPEVEPVNAPSLEVAVTAEAERDVARCEHGLVSKVPTLCLPTQPVRTVDVMSRETLRTALANAQPGDWILVADGVYPGSFVLDRDGTPQAPIVLRARSLGRARFTGKITLAGDHGVVAGLLLDRARFEVTGDHVRVTRNELTRGANESEAGLWVEGGASYCRIDHNELHHMVGRGIALKFENSDPKIAVGNRLDHNYLHHWSGKPGLNSHEGIQIGTHVVTEDVDHHGSMVERNLLESVGIDVEAISIKASGNVVRFNTLLRSDARINVRHGSRNEVRCNCTKDSRGIGIHGDDHLVIGNFVSGGELSVMAGSTTLGGVVGVPPWENHASARCARLVGNTVTGGARIGIGAWTQDGFPRFPAEDSWLDGNYGPVVLLFQRGTVEQGLSLVGADEAVCLTPEHVGLHAADPDCPGGWAWLEDDRRDLQAGPKERREPNRVNPSE